MVHTMSSRFLARRMAEIARVRRITEVLIRNGLGFLGPATGPGSLSAAFLRRQTVRADEAVGSRTVPQRCAALWRNWAATYIKVGQFLSGRADLLPPAYIEELSKLLDAAPPVACR